MSVIAHIDADCFYVSCERIRDTSLIGQAVGVLGNQGACVIARSYEMKAKGVTVGMPIWKAKQFCPDGVYIKRDFEWYGVISHQMQDILKRYSDAVEFYSVDESFIDLGDYRGDWGKIAKEIQMTILKELRVPVSIGISMTWKLAKIGSDKNKPFGITIMNEENLKEELATTPIEDIHGIGIKLRSKLKGHGIHTALDYVNTPRKQIRALLNKPGEELWYELQGKSLIKLKTERPQRKIVSRGGSIWGHHKDPKYIYGFLLRNLERFVDAIWRYQVEVGTLIVVLVGSDERYFKSVQKLPDYTDEYEIFLSAVKKSFKQTFKKGLTYSAVHIIGQDIRSVHGKQLNLFDQKNEQALWIRKAKELVNGKFGPFTLRTATTAYCPEVFRDKNSDFEICDIDGKLCF